MTARQHYVTPNDPGGPPYFQILDGAAERRRVWQTMGCEAYARLMYKQFGPGGDPAAVLPDVTDAAGNPL